MTKRRDIVINTVWDNKEREIISCLWNVALKNFDASDGERLLMLECVSLLYDRLRPLQEHGMQRPWPH